MAITRRDFIKSSIIFSTALAFGIFPNSTSASEKLSGLSYGPFRDGQSPDQGIYPSVEQIEEDISILSQITNSLMSYGVDHSLKEIPRLCRKYGIDCHAGGWIDRNGANNEKTIDDLLDVADAAATLVVGNEVLLWGYQSEANLIEYIRRVKSQTNIPVTTSEVWDLCLDHPDLMEELDYLSVHVHPYWEGIPVENAAQYAIDRWNDVINRYPHKIVILSETGWPSGGDAHIDAFPSEENQKRFLDSLMSIAKSDYLFFEAFDEIWKASNEGEVGAHWGLLYSDGHPKPAAEQFNITKHRTYNSPASDDQGGGCFISTIR